jgi:uracil-DNA glycosylase
MTVRSSNSDTSEALNDLLGEIRACRRCVVNPIGVALPHEPRPVLRASTTARLLIASQAPGIRVHNSGMPFTDASGDRLRQWMDVDKATFYDETRIAIVPMGFCFPGWTTARADLPPRPECRAEWHDRLFARMPNLTTILVVGTYARAYHFARLGLPTSSKETLSEVVARWPDFLGGKLKVIPLPHPSWRNGGWLKANPWFERELLPVVRREVRAALGVD